MYNDYPDEIIPTVLTLHNILKKYDLVKPIYLIFDLKKCNEVWNANYKGKFFMGNRKYCHPLTMVGSKSRFVFTAKGHYKESLQLAKTEFTKVFRKYGLPKQIHTDNGSPVGSVAAIQRFTRLSYWFIELGIQPVFSDLSHPEQNGRHERIHCDFKAACESLRPYALKDSTSTFKSFCEGI